MITFIVGLLILLFGWIFYSSYIEKQFNPSSDKTPAYKINDKTDYIPLSLRKNFLVQFLNIAGLGPILGAIQGVLFGPVAFILIPLGCIFLGGVHDYFSGMISLKNNGLQLTGLIKKYLGKFSYFIFVIVTSVLVLLITTVFVYTAGDLIAQRYLGQSNFSIQNPVIVSIYTIILLYYILATLLPIDKIIGRIYPLFAICLIAGTLLILAGFFTNGVHLVEIDFKHLNLHKSHFAIIPIFFMTVSCGLLSGFHSTQSTIIARTLQSEYEGKKVFYGSMCLECLVAMIWAAAAMSVYSQNTVPDNLIGQVPVINIITDTFVPYYLAFIVTAAVAILPITSGDTALRAFRIIIAEIFHLEQKSILKRLIITIPASLLVIFIVYLAKTNQDGFFMIWRYFNFVNQVLVIPTFMYTTVYLIKNKKNFFVSLIPLAFSLFTTATFILNAKIGFKLPFGEAKVLSTIFTIFSLLWLLNKAKKKNVE